MNKKRLKILSNYLRTVVAKKPRRRFSMADWWMTAKEAAEYFDSDIECGTVGCAMGWACEIPELKNAGLYRDKHNCPAYGDSSWGFGAAMNLFSISLGDAQYLFEPSCYRYGSPDDIRPCDVADRIDAFIKEGTHA